MRYNVEISELAEKQYDSIINYLVNVKKNAQAADGVIIDFDFAIDKLENQPEVYPFCKDDRLKEMGFHKLKLKSYRYFLVYRINGDMVTIEGMYHELQDYENVIG